MASSGLQLLGFFLSLVGLAATVAATLMVEWKKYYQGNTHRFFEGLWMSCSGNEGASCEFHQSLLNLPIEVLVTRVGMLLSILLSSVALLVSTVGMKCTHFIEARPDSKSITAMIGGIMFMVSGLLTIIITSWFVNMIVQAFQESHRQESFEFGNAAFVSWAGGFLTMAGGAFLGCRRCRRSGSESLCVSAPRPLHTAKTSNYV